MAHRLAFGEDESYQEVVRELRSGDRTLRWESIVAHSSIEGKLKQTMSSLGLSRLQLGSRAVSHARESAAWELPPLGGM